VRHRIREAMAEIDRALEKQAEPLKGMPVIVNHKDLSYLIAWLGMREVGALEPKRGLPPTSAQLGDRLARLAKEPAISYSRHSSWWRSPLRG
jgi:zinc/manganese transport system substrate-binding protein